MEFVKRYEYKSLNEKKFKLKKLPFALFLQRKGSFDEELATNLQKTDILYNPPALHFMVDNIICRKMIALI